MKRKHDKPAMEPAADAPAGMERDSRGRAIAIKDRTPDDRQKAHRARQAVKKKPAGTTVGKKTATKKKIAKKKK
jgi:hypothetical protein